MKKLEKFYFGLGTVMDGLSAFAMAVIFIVVFTNVVLRYVFRTGFAWATELGQYAFVLVCFTGLITATRDGSHFAVTLLIDRVPSIVRRVLNIIIDIAMLVITVMLIAGGFQMAGVAKGAVTPCMHIPMATNYWELVVCGILMAVYTVVNLGRHCIELVKPEFAKKEGDNN